MKNQRGHSLLVIALLAWAGTATGAQEAHSEKRGEPQAQIVFVCEHGAALSVVSAAYFNKLARERHINIHAIARGTTPQEDIAVSARDGLKADGVVSETARPQALSRKDVIHARRVVSFTPLPAMYLKMAPVETWADVPPTGAGYAAARDAILRHIEDLLRELRPARP